MLFARKHLELNFPHSARKMSTSRMITRASVRWDTSAALKASRANASFRRWCVRLNKEIRGVTADLELLGVHVSPVTWISPFAYKLRMYRNHIRRLLAFYQVQRRSKCEASGFDSPMQ